MIFLKYLLLWGGVGMMVAGAGLLVRDLYRLLTHKPSTSPDATVPPAPALEVHWRRGLAARFDRRRPGAGRRSIGNR